MNADIPARQLSADPSQIVLRRIIQNCAFGTLLGMAATYALTATVAALLAADSLARNSIVIPQLLD